MSLAVAPEPRAPADGAVAVRLHGLRRGRLWRDAGEIRALAQVAQDCARDGPGQDLDRAEALLRRIAAIAGPAPGGHEG